MRGADGPCPTGCQQPGGILTSDSLRVRTARPKTRPELLRPPTCALRMNAGSARRVRDSR